MRGPSSSASGSLKSIWVASLAESAIGPSAVEPELLQCTDELVVLAFFFLEDGMAAAEHFELERRALFSPAHFGFERVGLARIEDRDEQRELQPVFRHRFEERERSVHLEEMR